MSDLARLGRRSYVSLNGLENLLKDLKALERLPDASSRATIKRARDADCKVNTALGPTFSSLRIQVNELDRRKGTTSVREHELPFISLPAVLSHAIATSDGFRDFFLDRLRACPNGPTSPWKIVLYADEITPGNALKPLNSRKVHGFYVSFAEFGAELSSETLWFTVLAARSELVNKMEGGFSELFKLFLIRLFEGPFNLKTGCMLDFGNGQQHLFFASPTIFVADESCIKFAWDLKGASGSVCCMFCSNVVSQNNRLDVHDATNTLVTIAEVDDSKWRARGDQLLWASHDRLETIAGSGTKAELQRVQQAMGLNHNPKGLLRSRLLAPSSVTMYDWMHCYLVHGLLQLELGLLIPMFYGAGHTVATILSFFNSFEWPHGLRAHRREVLQIFEKKVPLGEFKCSASQGLSIYPLVRIFVLVHAVSLAEATVRQACNSFLKLCMVLDLLLEGNKGQPIGAPELRTRIAAHSQAFLKVHGEEAVIPKFHYALHLPSQLHRHGRLISCFCHERKHKQIKAVADNLHKVTTTFEHTVMADVVGKSFLNFEGYKLWTKPSLMKAKPASDQLAVELATAFGVAQALGSMVGLVAEFQPGQTCERGDTVLVETIVAEVWLHVQLANGEVHSLVSVWQSLGQNRFQVREQPCWIATNTINKAVLHRRRAKMPCHAS
ncbi:hypothetical protein AK812_SmicGene2515 [Symbiodinium microadriaticum]|uniref:Uncharacterized protein n=1 Tax=Symbiodinium microadriaticum TaxID=2951 RepID=A0A1Q9F1E1_SYMMI|nr:hypothetical protein AK812_SmicGene2515 [Symbiodinium microadriaticum]